MPWRWRKAGRDPLDYFSKHEGRFPLVLVVHGNHDMKDFSDPGYAYLGELLASRGYIMVSVDMNFINGLSGENDGRGCQCVQKSAIHSGPFGVARDGLRLWSMCVPPGMGSPCHAVRSNPLSRGTSSVWISSTAEPLSRVISPVPPAVTDSAM